MAERKESQVTAAQQPPINQSPSEPQAGGCPLGVPLGIPTTAAVSPPNLSRIASRLQCLAAHSLFVWATWRRFRLGGRGMPSWEAAAPQDVAIFRGCPSIVMPNLPMYSPFGARLPEQYLA
ncbi:hypothetical protein PG997_007753 [Apiospora hydei]|uniref:Uncharacterized protein n=1 Tax=Apiospora hydei TaxID=1337664 RepID=A0ABR1W8W1_9PEZI